MAGLGNITTTLITTRGLFIDDVVPPGFTALSFGAGITPWFRLFINEAPPPPPPNNYVAAAGSRPYAPGEIAHLYQPIDPATGLRIDAKKDGMEEYLVVPMDKEAEFLGGSKIITLKLSFAGRNLEKVYSVSENRAKSIVEVVNVINATKKRISIIAEGMKALASDAIVKVGKFRLRNKQDK